ncbi:MAG: PDZ domain-containing protein [Firmicutes bacterium]|nr:PDZ domain-containing protein [Bacillota bacterium]
MKAVRRPSLTIAFLLILIICAISSPYLRAFIGLPRHIRMLEGQSREFPVRLPLGLYIRSDEEGDIFMVNDSRIEKSGFSLKRGAVAKFSPLNLGTADVQVRLLGVVPIGKVKVDVLPRVSVVPGGQAIGVLLTARGVIVVGHYPLVGIDGRRYYPAQEAGIEVGDVIVSINGAPVEGATQVERLIDIAGREHKEIDLGLERNGQDLHTKIKPVPTGVGAGDVRSGLHGGGPYNDLHGDRDNGPGDSGGTGTIDPVKYRIGVYIKDNAAGVGTLSFFDPEKGVYGALGHVITDANTNQEINVRDGRIVAAQIIGIQQGQRGQPGEKIGVFGGGEDVLGTIERNTKFGIFGKMTLPPREGLTMEPIPIALAEEVTEGEAEMLTVIKDDKVEGFKVEIERVLHQTNPGTKGLIIRVTDPRLIAMTGGIVQGMSGSPIIKDGRLCAIVTHVFLADPRRGYATLAEWMAREAGLYPGTSSEKGVSMLPQRRRLPDAA